MQTRTRVLVALTILLSGVVLGLLPTVSWSAGSVEWQRFAGAYKDVVLVTRARYDQDDQFIEVRATSTDPAAQLTVLDARTQRVIGQMVSAGDGSFRLEKSWPRYPRRIMVVSSSGGRAIATVELR